MEEYIGSVKLFTGTFTPRFWLECNGATLKISEYSTLFSVIGFAFGGDGKTTFQLPNLTPPATGLRWIICNVGIYPQRP